MVISTTSNCPECLKAGKQNLLQIDISASPNRVYCSDGHVVTKAEQLSAPPPKESPAQPQEPPLNPQQMALEPPPSAKVAIDASQVPPTPVSQPSAASAPLLELPLVENPAHVVVLAAARPLSPLERLSKVGYYQTAGGDLMVQVRIPEIYAGPLKEAAARYYPPTPTEPDTLQKHVQAVMETALRLGWAD